MYSQYNYHTGDIHPSKISKDENTPEWDYYWMTKFWPDHRVDFDGNKFIVYHHSTNDYKNHSQRGEIYTTWDNFKGKIYPVEHKILKNKGK